ncbi:unnamed protein product [Nezara viridula]|uniref:Mannosyl-oligosaccharide glucosidase n=1 Tax=Nezara viridula TaxID=85310 RepID=A0A9P0E397_NEZVI|nr:unnamed protein product [Nezara viridula]
MSKPRKPLHSERSKKHAQNDAKKPPEEGFKFSLKTIVTLICLGVACCIGYKGYLETRVNTPFDSNKVVVKSGLAVPERYWGSYRPGNYFGFKTREPYSPVMGLMWYFPRRLGAGGEGFRHWCEQGDGLSKYGWQLHDGKNFGVQELNDDPFILTTEFVKRQGGNHGGDWSARITVKPKEGFGRGELVNLVFYTGIESGTRGRISPTRNTEIPGVVGETQELGQFVVRYANTSGQLKGISYLSVEGKGLHLLKETIMSTLRVQKNRLVLPGDLTRLKEGTVPNLVATQFEATVPFQFEVSFESGSFVDRPNSLTEDVFTRELNERIQAFHEKFENTFNLTEYSLEEINFAKAVFSNLIGGIGYFYGASRVRSDHTKTPVPYWKAPLFTAVPSRSFFPRGFLWDEGFHGLLLAAWDLDLELDIMSHWFDLMNIEGWIPREQILGQEALAKVPEEFVTQTNTNANPPTFFLTLRFIMENYADRLTEEDRLGALERLYPRLVAWFDWFNNSQTGNIGGSYRWKGRDPAAPELNPKTMASGFDDYPRASHPTSEERHLDLRCWILLGAATLADITKILSRSGGKYWDTYHYLSDTSLLDRLHWSEAGGRYADYGLHTDDVAFKTRPQPHRVVLTDPTPRLVDSVFGYVSLFPFFVHILPSNSIKLQKILTDLRNPQLLWTPYGLRSLAKNSPLYNKWNTEHDPPYWRSPIWINMNYLTLGALHYYSKLDGPYQSQARIVYKQLRSNLINNIFKEYKKTGYVWEHYNDKTGAGGGSHPFTGWTSLVVLIMAEMY